MNVCQHCLLFLSRQSMTETVFFAENAVSRNKKMQERVDSRVSFQGSK